MSINDRQQSPRQPSLPGAQPPGPASPSGGQPSGPSLISSSSNQSSSSTTTTSGTTSGPARLPTSRRAAPSARQVAALVDDDAPIATRLRTRQVQKRKSDVSHARTASPDVSDDESGDRRASGGGGASDSDSPIETKAPARRAPRNPVRRRTAAHSGLREVVEAALTAPAGRTGRSGRAGRPDAAQAALTQAMRTWLTPEGKPIDLVRMRSGLAEIIPLLRDASAPRREQIIHALVQAQDPSRDLRAVQSSIARILVRSGHHLKDALLHTTRCMVREFGAVCWRTQANANNRANNYDTSFVLELLSVGSRPHCAQIWLGLMQEMASAPGGAALIEALHGPAMKAKLDSAPIRGQILRYYGEGLARFHGGPAMSGERLQALAGRLFDFPAEADEVPASVASQALLGIADALAPAGWRPEHWQALRTVWFAAPQRVPYRTQALLPALIQPTMTPQGMRRVLDDVLAGADAAPTATQNALLLEILRTVSHDFGIPAEAFAAIAGEIGEQFAAHLASAGNDAANQLAHAAGDILAGGPAQATARFMSGLVRGMATLGMLGDDDAPRQVLQQLIDPPGLVLRRNFWSPAPHARHSVLEGVFDGLLRHAGAVSLARLQALARTAAALMFLEPPEQVPVDAQPQHPLWRAIEKRPEALSPERMGALVRGCAQGLPADVPTGWPIAWNVHAACRAAATLDATRRNAVLEQLAVGLGGSAITEIRAGHLAQGLISGLAAMSDPAERDEAARAVLTGLGGAQMRPGVVWQVMRAAAQAPAESASAAAVLAAAAAHLLGDARTIALSDQARTEWDRPNRFVAVDGARSLERRQQPYGPAAPQDSKAGPVATTAEQRRTLFNEFQSRYAPDDDAVAWRDGALALGLRLGVDPQAQGELLALRTERLRGFARTGGEASLGIDPVLAGLIEAIVQRAAATAQNPPSGQPPTSNVLALQTVQAALLAVFAASTVQEPQAAVARTLDCVLRTASLTLDRFELAWAFLRALRNWPAPVGPATAEAVGAWFATFIAAVDVRGPDTVAPTVVLTLLGWHEAHLQPDAILAAASAIGRHMQADTASFAQEFEAILLGIARHRLPAPGLPAQPAVLTAHVPRTVLQAVVTGLCPAANRAGAFLKAIRGLPLADLQVLLREAGGAGAPAACVDLFNTQLPTWLATPEPVAGGVPASDPLTDGQLLRLSLAWFLGRDQPSRRETTVTLATQFRPATGARRAATDPWARAARIALHPADMDLLADTRLSEAERKALLLAVTTVRLNSATPGAHRDWSNAVAGGLPDAIKPMAVAALTPLFATARLGIYDLRSARMQLMENIDVLRDRLGRTDPAPSAAEHEALETQIASAAHDLVAMYSGFKQMRDIAFAYLPERPAAQAERWMRGTPQGDTNRAVGRSHLAFLERERAQVQRPHVHPLVNRLMTTLLDELARPLREGLGRSVAGGVPAADIDMEQGLD